MGCTTSSVEIPDTQIETRQVYTSEPDILEETENTTRKYPATPHPRAKFSTCTSYPTDSPSVPRLLPPFLFTLETDQFLQFLKEFNIQGSYRQELVRQYNKDYFKNHRRSVSYNNLKTLSVLDAPSDQGYRQPFSFTKWGSSRRRYKVLYNSSHHPQEIVWHFKATETNLIGI